MSTVSIQSGIYMSLLINAPVVYTIKVYASTHILPMTTTVHKFESLLINVEDLCRNEG